ncbi:DNA polymerase III subunit delta [Collinsella sp. An2]|uniref:DNA polymerase III subunit delta n=1 Tax=Collinsella sp. An2 TaxID=1965585 RepID=UPI000B3705B5|nr:DNA polymerase III subunit delta [Collinsella sp. An2]OUP07832.1 DNA polymerase III subunit delta [Collinsella sp. An2]
MAETALLPAYLIVGADEVKRDTAIARLKDRLAASGMADFNLDERDMQRDQEPDDVLSSLNTFPMGSDFRLVILRGCDKLPKPMSEMLVSYLADPAPTTVCLVVAGSLAKNTRLYKAIQKVGPKAIIDCASKKRWEVPRQVQGMVRRYGKTISTAAAEELVSRVGENTRMLDNELKKLSQMVEAPQIERADVERLVVRTAEVKPWDFLDAMSARDLPRTLELLHLLPPRSEIRTYSLVCSRLRELLVAKALDARGQGRDLASHLGVQSWQVKNHLTWARRFSTEELVDALRGAVQVEESLKGSKDSETALLTWVVDIVSR